MRSRSAYIRAIAACIAVPAITVYCVWLVRVVAISAFESSKAGQLVRQYDYVAPQIERHAKEIEELTRP
jgi:hypothetical protein